MLVLSRRVGEVIVVDGRIRIKVTSINHAKVHIGIDAPPTVRILRSEIGDRASTVVGGIAKSGKREDSPPIEVQ
jgi:carbon storage regulator